MKQKRNRTIAWLLLLISMIMLVVPVVPHHHHTDGRICMKNDITTTCCGPSETYNQQTDETPQTPDYGFCGIHNHGDHCCCDTGCLTTHYYNQPQQGNPTHEIHPDFLWVTTLFCEPILQLLLSPQRELRRMDCVYHESLHGTQLVRATGLRAPPCC